MPLTVEPLPDLFEDPEILVLGARVDDDAIASMSPAEAAAVAKAGAKRRREFATARKIAREGLARLGVRDFDLLTGEDRAPRWPEGIRGSISHCDTRAWVALTHTARGTVGIDGEHRVALKEELFRMTMLTEEIAEFESVEPAARGGLALAFFSAKEALYKAQYPRSGEYMGFHALRVTREGPGILRCVFQKEVGPFPEGFVARARWRVLDSGELVSAVHIPP